MKNLKETFIICNPKAGGGLATKKWEKFSELLKTSQIQVESKLTQYPGHATKISADLVEKGYKRIAVFGGDGTLNEVLQGVINNDRIKSNELILIFLGAGSSCDFEKVFEQRQSLLDRLLSEKTYLIDVCKVECRDFKGLKIVRYFVANSSIGVISLAIQKFDTATRLINLLKKVSVDAAALSVGFKALLEFDEVKCNLKLDNKELWNLKLKNLTVFKSPYFGGGMNYGIKTRADDGIFHIGIIDSISRLKLFSLIPSLYTGKIFFKKPAHYDQCKFLEIISNQKVFIETDGEIIGYPPAKYSIFPKALRVIV
ncbi:MAG: diacylglycerol/lipid kinase family protein [Candidatus Aminicenantia bacterium]